MLETLVVRGEGLEDVEAKGCRDSCGLLELGRSCLVLVTVTLEVVWSDMALSWRAVLAGGRILRLARS